MSYRNTSLTFLGFPQKNGLAHLGLNQAELSLEQSCIKPVVESDEKTEHLSFSTRSMPMIFSKEQFITDRSNRRLKYIGIVVKKFIY